jgi:hypothetical protein
MRSSIALTARPGFDPNARYIDKNNYWVHQYPPRFAIGVLNLLEKGGQRGAKITAGVEQTVQSECAATVEPQPLADARGSKLLRRRSGELALAVRRLVLKGSGGAFGRRCVAVARLIALFHAQPEGL